MTIDRAHSKISISRQCELLGLPFSTLYYQPKETTELNLMIMNAIDAVFTQYPFYGARRISDCLRVNGLSVSRGKVGRLMKFMEIEAIYPKKSLSRRNPEHRVYPYLLRGLTIDHPDQVWCSDVTFIRLKHGFAYLTVVMDWYSRYVVSWELSMTMDKGFTLRCLNRALETSIPEIFNTDQGSQFTSNAFTGVLSDAGISISMDGKGRAFDNIMVERLWRTVKYEEVYLNEYKDFFEGREQLEKYFSFYNNERNHSSLGKMTTPAAMYHGYRTEKKESA
jgi:putative transposase